MRQLTVTIKLNFDPTRHDWHDAHLEDIEETIKTGLEETDDFVITEIEVVEGQYMVDANGIYHTHGYPS